MATDPSIPSAGPAPVRVHVFSLDGVTAGARVKLPADQSRHLTRVRRLGDGAVVEVFDDAGRVARGLLREDLTWAVELNETPARSASRAITVYSAVPKGNRADWMVEKLGELGVTRLVPLRTRRSVVDPGGGKLDRFRRLAREAAKQSRSRGVMQIEDPSDLEVCLGHLNDPASAAVLTTERPGASLLQLPVTDLFVGPEGGWTSEELDAFLAAGVRPATLTQSILRIETAALCAAAVVMMSPVEGSAD